VTATLRVLLAICLGLSGLAQGRAQTPAVPVAGIDAGLIEDIVIGSRILADFGVLDGFGHVSARHPTNPNHFLMSRSLAPALVTADDIMEFDLDGNPVDARGRSLFLERFIHSEIYKARPDVMAVVHSHSPGVIPFSVSQVPLRPMYHNPSFLAAGAISLGGDINYLTPGEGAKADQVNFVVIDRIWNLWKMRVAPTLAK
jgi:ribulose-5-phosphate 4-epimerase/fuculose-1-phosphate aldolase